MTHLQPGGLTRALLHAMVGVVLGLAAVSALAQPIRLVPVVGQNFTGATYRFDAGVPPPDSMGAVGPDHFVQLINSRYAVFEKRTGRLVQASTLDEFWDASWGPDSHLPNPNLDPDKTTLWPQSGAFDPRIVFDAASRRWYATAESSMHLLIAVSNSADPTQGWHGFQIDSPLGASAAPDAPWSVPLFTLADIYAAILDSRSVDPLRSFFTLTANQAEFARRSGNDDVIALTPDARVDVLEKGQRWMIRNAKAVYDNGVLVGWAKQHFIIRREGAGVAALNVYYYAYDQNYFDFPTLGMDADNLYVATQFHGNPFFVISKAALRSAKPPNVAYRLINDNGTMRSAAAQPVLDLDGHPEKRALVVSLFGSTVFFTQIGKLSIPCDSTGCPWLVGTLQLTAYDGVGSAAQPGAGRGTASSHDIQSNGNSGSLWLSSSVVLRNRDLHGVQMVGVGGTTRLRYFRIRVAYDDAADQFTFTTLDDQLVPVPAAAPQLNAFYGSVAVNGRSQLFIGFTGSSSDEYASAYGVAGEIDAVRGQVVFGAPFVLKAGHDEYELGAGATGVSPGYNNRWGDYSATSVDPDDPYRFWTIQEWASSLDIWSTQITEIRLVPWLDLFRPFSVTASVRGSATPPVRDFGTLTAGAFDNGAAVPNRDFTIAANLPMGRRDAVVLGDGVDETTLWSFNFAQDLRSSAFFREPQPRLLSALLTLTLVAHADCSADSIAVPGLAPIPLAAVFPGMASTGCAAGQRFTGAVNLLRFYSSTQLASAWTRSPHVLRMKYSRNAILNHASLTLVRAP